MPSSIIHHGPTLAAEWKAEINARDVTRIVSLDSEDVVSNRRASSLSPRSKRQLARQGRGQRLLAHDPAAAAQS